MAQWSISYTDVFGKKKVESFESQGEAQARYEALIPRTYGDLGDLVEVTAPIKSAVKVSESVTDVDLSNQWDDLEAVVKGLFIRGFDNPRGNYFYVKTLYSNPDEATYSVYSRGSDSLMLEIHVLGDGDSPCVAVVNQGLQDKAFEKACSVIEPVMKDWFSMVTDGFHGSLAYIDTPSEYALWKKSKGFKNEDGASAASLGAVPTATVRPSNKRESVFDDDELERTGDQAPWGKMKSRDRKALQDAYKVVQKYRPDATIDPKRGCITFTTDEGPNGSVSISTETFTGFGGSSDIHTRYDVRHKAWGSYDTFSTEDFADLDIILKGINAGVFKHTDTWDEFVRKVRRATRKKRSA